MAVTPPLMFIKLFAVITGKNHQSLVVQRKVLELLKERADQFFIGVPNFGIVKIYDILALIWRETFENTAFSA